MRRQALPFITAWMKGRSAKDTKLLDVASGTGRFLTFVRDNFPAGSGVCRGADSALTRKTQWNC